MAVKIGHASIDERGKTSGGQAGDQTGREVCTRDWYNKSWIAVIRPKNASDAEKIAKAMEQICANNNIGYDQSNRTSLYTQAKAKNWNISKITVKCETDCSAGVSVCVNAAGISVSKDMYTGNEEAVLKQTGKFTVLKESKYLTGDSYLKRGDILLSSGHTAVVLSNGSKASSSSTSSTAKPSTSKTNSTYTKKQFIKDVQSATGAKVDGVAGPETLSKTVTVSAKKNKKHAVVKAIQKYLYALGYTSVGSADGEAGAKFTTAVNEYQKKVLKYSNVDGEITAVGKMWKSLLGM